MRVRLTDIRDHSVQELDLSLESRDMAGWQNGVAGWSIGGKGSGAPIELDESLGECHVGVFTSSFQVLIWGEAKVLPAVWIYPHQGRLTSSLVPFEPERWFQIEREELRRVAMGGDVKLRFDQSPIRFGNYILENLQPIDPAKECCAFCNEVLTNYFRVGNQQVCPLCTEKFIEQTRARRTRYYRRALFHGIVAAVAGALIHSLMLFGAGISFGSILIGILVGLVIRRASEESAEAKHRFTAVALTLVAGAIPLWIGGGTYFSLIYLAVGLIAAWTISARNVRTEIHGPFRSKTAP